jgi:hypothetical protein
MMSCDRLVSIESHRSQANYDVDYQSPNDYKGLGPEVFTPSFITTMMKRARSPSPLAMSKKGRTTHSHFAPIKIATASAAATVQTNPPFLRLLDALRNVVQKPSKGQSIVYWMRMGDLRSRCCFFLICDTCPF